MPSKEADNVDEALFLNVLHNHMAVNQITDSAWVHKTI